MPLFTVGSRVELHPATDAWMRGDRYGEILAVRCRRGRVVYTLRTDSGREIKVTQGNISQEIF